MNAIVDNETSPVKTLEEVRGEFLRKGVPISRWARENQIPRGIAYAVLSGRCPGHYGAAHRAAVLLGLKVGEIQ